MAFRTRSASATRGRSAAHVAVAVGLGLGLATARAVQAQDVVAVLSSDLQPYREALAGFEAALGRNVPHVDLAAARPEIGAETRVVVAFGGKAALLAYPERVTLVYCMAPGAVVRGATSGSIVQVNMLPPPAALVLRLRQVQPGMRRLLVFWASPSVGGYLEELQRAGRSVGLEVVLDEVRDAGEIPARLRASMERPADAIWLVHDPLLVNAKTFAVLKDFSWANDVPFYAPNAGFVEAGAVAAVSVTFRDIGRTAAAAVQQVLSAHDRPAPQVYPETSELAINLTAAAQAGLRTPPEILQKAERVIP